MKATHKSEHIDQRREWIAKVLRSNASPPIYCTINTRCLSAAKITIARTEKGERIYQDGKPISEYFKPEK